jgi:hypothetical protein
MNEVDRLDFLGLALVMVLLVWALLLTPAIRPFSVRAVSFCAWLAVTLLFLWVIER